MKKIKKFVLYALVENEDKKQFLYECKTYGDIRETNIIDGKYYVCFQISTPLEIPKQPLCEVSEQKKE